MVLSTCISQGTETIFSLFEASSKIHFHKIGPLNLIKHLLKSFGVFKVYH